MQARRLLLMPLALLLSACGGVPLVHETTNEAVTRETARLVQQVRDAWELPTQVQVYLANAEDGAPLPAEEEAR